MKLHWSSPSPYVRKVMICACERGIAAGIERNCSLVSLSRTNPAVMRDNPLGKIPTLTPLLLMSGEEREQDSVEQRWLFPIRAVAGLGNDVHFGMRHVLGQHA